MDSQNYLKKCPSCGITKTSDEFWISRTAKNGLQTYCIECYKVKDKASRMKRRLSGPSIQRTQKICNRCQQMKPISQFGVRRDAADGRLSYCKPCWVTYVQLAQLKSKK